MKVRKVRGTRDILPDKIRKWQYIEKIAREILENFGFQEIRTPLFEKTPLFNRSIGEATDIVAKEMYTFKDRKGRSLTLRPEGTAPIVRAYLENRLPTPVKLYYLGSFYRYERPQAGRYREFYQIGAETIGSDSPVSDAEIISLTMTLLKKLGLKDLILQLNSAGCRKCQPEYKKTLKNYFREKLNSLCDDCKRRYRKNPLRILDCKSKGCQRYIIKAPVISEYLCGECRGALEEVKRYLNILKIKYIINPRLVRGLDYYTRTAFEITSRELGAQNAIAAGGRYDDLIEDLGGPSTPAVGVALGTDRLILALEREEVKLPVEEGIDIYLASLGKRASKKGFALVQRLREKNLKVEGSLSSKSLKSQMRLANRLGARYVLILGEEERAKKRAILKNMATGKQEEIPLSKIIEEVSREVKK
ncbi:MAG TPA: histidine--tRNA ligase [bacterium]|nr:histidine--tRNA ligase [bacterium]